MLENIIKPTLNIRHFLAFLLLGCMCYLIIELTLIPHLVLAYDEFWFAQHIFQYTNKVPYRDFLPYKPVLGYYFLSLPMFFSHTALTPLFLIKDQIALTNTFFIIATAYWSLRFFNPKAILLTLIILFSSHFFLIYSADLRVDMLASWLGLVAALFVLSKRFMLAGLTLALSFLFSQKGLWFFVAINFGLGMQWLWVERTRQLFLSIAFFNSIFLVSVGLYLVCWSLVSNPAVVLQSVFYEGFTQAKISWYSQIYKQCWQMILNHGPLFFVLTPLTWLTLCLAPLQARKVFILGFSTMMVMLLVMYQQPFLYNIMFLIPAFFLLYSEFFTDLLAIINRSSAASINRRFLFWFVSLYVISIVSLFIIMDVVSGYYLIALIPVSVGFLMNQKLSLPHTNLISQLLLVILIFTGILYPLLPTAAYAYTFRNDYQTFNLIAAEKLLHNNEGYFAGTPMLYEKKQSIPGLENLISPAIAYLYEPDPELLPILIPSLNLVAISQQEILANLKTKPVKLFINNNRIMYLPQKIFRYLFANYAHYWGNIYLYAPRIESSHFDIAFDGHYQVMSSHGNVRIDQQSFTPGSIINLTKGRHFSESGFPFQLKLIPAIDKSLPFDLKEDKWELSVKL